MVKGTEDMKTKHNIFFSYTSQIICKSKDKIL
jgi:hypothetical protein